MSLATALSVPATGRWICPFCPLLCEQERVADDLPPGTGCGRAVQRLGALSATAASGAHIDGRPCTPAEALRVAASILRASRQPLFGGLGTDVAGARTLYPLACATGAISDAAAGPAFMQGQRVLQDRGGFTTTLAELRTRADLVLCLDGLFFDAAPRFIDRCLLPPRSAGRVDGTALPGPRQVVLLGGTAADAALAARLAQSPAVALEHLPLAGDLLDSVALLAALVAGRAVPEAPPAWVALAQRLRTAQYAVIVGAPGGLPAHGALAIEAVHRLVDTLNLTSRAAALWLGGGEGTATVNQVFTWLSGVSLRSRLGPHGLEHQPLLFDAGRLLADGAVDALLWVSSFDARALPPAAMVPRVVLGPPALGAALAEAGAAGGRPATVFIPVATPGVHAAGDLFRTDGTVMLPLVPLPGLAPAGLHDLASVVGQLMKRLAEGASA